MSGLEGQKSILSFDPDLQSISATVYKKQARPRVDAIAASRLVPVLSSQSLLPLSSLFRRR